MENEESLNSLIDFIIEKYHNSVRKNLPILENETQKLIQEFWEKFPELIQIAELLKQFKIEIDKHINIEEDDFFPILRKLEDKIYWVDCNFVNFINIIRKLEIEHEHFDTYVYSLFEIFKLSWLKLENEFIYDKFYNYFSLLESETKEHTEIENLSLHPLAREKFKIFCWVI